MKTAAKRVLRTAWRAVPGKTAIARVAALSPPAFKGPITQRILSRLIEAPDLIGMGKIETNLGLDMPTVVIEGRARSHLFFGTPEGYAGERGALALASCLSRHSDAFIDVGANYGYFTFLVANERGDSIPIHYIEPVPTLFADLDANVRRLGLRNAYGHQLAIGGSTGEVTFYLNLSNSHSSSLTPTFRGRHQLEEIVVRSSTFDDFAEGQTFRNACVKVDIENAEPAFLEGVQRHRDRIAFLVIEVLGPAIKAGFINTARAQLGMHAYYVDDRVLRPSIDGTYRYQPGECNWLFCRQAPDQLRPLLAGTTMRIAGS